MKQFGSTTKAEEISFKIRPSAEVFRALGECPGGLFIDLAAISEAESRTEKIGVINGFFKSVLTDDSLVKWEARFNSGAKKNPITLPAALEVFEWLVEQYAGDDLPTEGA